MTEEGEEGKLERGGGAEGGLRRKKFYMRDVGQGVLWGGVCGF